MQQDGFQIVCLRMRLSNKKQRIRAIFLATVGILPLLVPVEVSRLSRGKGPQEEGAAVAMLIEFVHARAAGAMKARPDPQTADLSTTTPGPLSAAALGFL